MSTADRQAKRFLREPAAYELKGAITPCMALWRHMTPKAVQGLVNAASRACHKLDALESQCDALEDRVADAEAEVSRLGGENAELKKRQERMWELLGKAEDLLNPGREHRMGMDPSCDICMWMDKVGDLTIIPWPQEPKT